MTPPQDTQTHHAPSSAVAAPSTQDFAAWIYARCGAVAVRREPPTITDGQRAAYEYWQRKQAERMNRGGK